jgi:hypothetical protein
MADMERLFRQVDQLSSEEVKAPFTYILEHRIDFRQPVPAPKPRVLGLHEHLGSGWMSDDFNDELPDSFWFGEE